MKNSLGHMPAGEWEFDEEVAECFPDMLERSIPELASMRRLVTEVASRFAFARGSAVVDLGASLGDSLIPIIQELGTRATYHAVESSPAFLAKLRERWPKGPVVVHQHDLRRGVPDFYQPWGCALAILTLQFLPLSSRFFVVEQAYEKTLPGGAFVLVEKVIPEEPALAPMFDVFYREMKYANGYSKEEVARKETSLRGVMQPMSPSWNEKLLRAGGFEVVETFWAAMNFRGWLAVKSR